MIEINLDGVRHICIEQLEILAAVRCMCTKNGLPMDWVSDWENKVAKVLRDVRLAIDSHGPVIVLED